MAKLIKFGKYNKLYKYLYFHIISKFIVEYLIESYFPDKTSIFDDHAFPKHRIVQEGFDYLGTLICSIFIYLYELFYLKIEEGLKTSTEIENTNLKESKTGSSEIDYIYEETGKIEIKLSDFYSIILLFFITQMIKFFYDICLKGLDFGMFQLLFICYISYKMFRMPIYIHKKYAIYFIIIFSTIFKVLSLGFRFVDDGKQRLFKIYKWIIPVGIIIFIFLTLIKSYSLCIIKKSFDLKFIQPSQFLIIYGFFGAFCCFISSIISSEVPCVDKNDFENIYYICNVTNNNETEYYYDSYSIFFDTLWDNDRKNNINVGFLFLFFFKILFSFFVKLFFLLIIKNLNPEYLICSDSIFYFLTEIVDFFYYTSKDSGFKCYKFFESLSELFCFLGIIFYLELIELNFWDLNHDLKKTIIKRSEDESRKMFIITDGNGRMSNNSSD